MFSAKPREWFKGFGQADSTDEKINYVMALLCLVLGAVDSQHSASYSALVFKAAKR